MALRIESVGRERTRDVLAPIEATMGFEMASEALDAFAALPEYESRLAAFEDDQILGALGSFTFEMTTPGGAVGAAGLTGVGVYPTHRRRGVLRELMRRYLDDLRGRGQAVSALWASEAPIYGRFGYGMASIQASIELDLGRASFVAGGGKNVQALVRTVEEDEALEACPAIYDALRRETPGMLSRSEGWWKTRRLDDPEYARRGRGPLRRVLVELAGKPVAYALFRQTHEWRDGVPGGAVNVNEAIGSSPEATRALWRYLCDIDLMDRITGWMLPADHPLILLVAEPRRLGLRLGDALWVRLVDIAAALAARKLGEGAVCLEVRDSFCPWNEGRWRIGGDGAERTRKAADLALDVRELGSVYLGGFTFAQLVRAGLAEELSTGAAARADALFVRDRAPWCPEIF